MQQLLLNAWWCKTPGGNPSMQGYHLLYSEKTTKSQLFCSHLFWTIFYDSQMFTSRQFLFFCVCKNGLADFEARLMGWQTWELLDYKECKRPALLALLIFHGLLCWSGAALVWNWEGQHPMGSHQVQLKSSLLILTWNKSHKLTLILSLLSINGCKWRKCFIWV